MGQLFSVGEIVKLKGVASPRMVVVRHRLVERDQRAKEQALLHDMHSTGFNIPLVINKDLVKCEWFDSHRRLQARAFLASLLERIE